MCSGPAGGGTAGPHAHRSHTVTAARDGVRGFAFPDRPDLILMPGQALFLPAGTVHACPPAAPGVGAVSLSIPARRAAPLARHGVSRLLAADWIGGLLDLAEGPGAPTARARLGGLLRDLDRPDFPALAVPRGPVPAAPPPDIARALALLEDAQPLERVARRCGLSPDGFGHRFRRHVGMPPKAWRLLQQVRRAAAALAGGAEIAEAALDAGFCDQSHLARHFTRFYGLTPGQYRAAFRAAEAEPA